MRMPFGITITTSMFGILLVLASCVSPPASEHDTSESKISEPLPEIRETPRQASIFKIEEVTTYISHPSKEPRREHLRTFDYGIYIKMPSDTAGVADAVIDYLKSKNIPEGEAAHVWVFTEKWAVPKHFKGEWGTDKMLSKCFAHAVQLIGGEYDYSYDMFGTYQP